MLFDEEKFPEDDELVCDTMCLTLGCLLCWEKRSLRGCLLRVI